MRQAVGMALDSPYAEQPIVWTLAEGLDLVRILQPKLRALDYHVVIGGGVINKGVSTKDLDLYLLPVFKNRPYQFEAIEQVIFDVVGKHKDLWKTSDQLEIGSGQRCFKYQWACETKDRKRVDVFIVDPQEGA